MIHSRELKKIAKKERKKISADAIELLGKFLKRESENIIKKAARNADFSGRKVIRKEDIEEQATN